MERTKARVPRDGSIATTAAKLQYQVGANSPRLLEASATLDRNLRSIQGYLKEDSTMYAFKVRRSYCALDRGSRSRCKTSKVLCCRALCRLRKEQTRS